MLQGAQQRFTWNRQTLLYYVHAVLLRPGSSLHVFLPRPLRRVVSHVMTLLGVCRRSAHHC